MKCKILIIAFTILTLGIKATPNWTVNTAQYEYSQTLTTTVQLEGGVEAAENDLLAAFVNNECRGVATATYVDAYEKHYFFLTVFSNQYEGEQVELRFYQSSADSIYAAISSLTFTDGENIGSASEPFIVGETESVYALEISSDTISENKPTNTFIGKLVAKENGAMFDANFQLLNSKSEFSISADSLFSATSFNYESKATYTIKIVAYSNDSLTVFEDSVQIKIENVDEPFELSLSNNTINENSGEDALIGVLKITSTGKTAIEVSLDSVLDIDAFYLKSDSLYAKQSFNYEDKNRFEIKVLAVALLDTIMQNFHINVSNVNEAPVNVTLSSDTITENMSSGTFIGKLSATDEDMDDSLTFQQMIPTGEDFTYFNIRNDSVFSYDVFDYEEAQKHILMVLVTDKAGLSAEGYFEILINDELEVSAKRVEQLQYTLYPNPVNDVLYIKGIEHCDKFEIYNSNGVLVKTDLNFSGKINLASLHEGVYFLKVFSQTNYGIQSFVIK